MWTVTYKYYNYPNHTKTFDNYTSAKKFVYYIGKKKGCDPCATQRSF